MFAYIKAAERHKDCSKSGMEMLGFRRAGPEWRRFAARPRQLAFVPLPGRSDAAGSDLCDSPLPSPGRGRFTFTRVTAASTAAIDMNTFFKTLSSQTGAFHVTRLHVSEDGGHLLRK